LEKKKIAASCHLPREAIAFAKCNETRQQVRASTRESMLRRISQSVGLVVFPETRPKCIFPVEINHLSQCCYGIALARKKRGAAQTKASFLLKHSVKRYRS
jgi:hypothetical protein